MTTNLTQRQKKVLNIIQDFIQRKGYPPTAMEIARKMNTKWVRAVQKHLIALENKGFLKRGFGLSRGITLAEPYRTAETPILGRIAAGRPLLAVENIEGTMKLGAAFSQSSPTFLLQVKGMSMKDAGILDGDLVLVRQQQTAEQGDIVAALLGDEATVKYFRKKNNAVILEPANSAFQPITVRREDQFSILGKVIASLRMFEGKP